MLCSVYLIIFIQADPARTVPVAGVRDTWHCTRVCRRGGDLETRAHHGHVCRGCWGQDRGHSPRLQPRGGRRPGGRGSCSATPPPPRPPQPRPRRGDAGAEAGLVPRPRGAGVLGTSGRGLASSLHLQHPGGVRGLGRHAVRPVRGAALRPAAASGHGDLSGDTKNISRTEQNYLSRPR